MDTLITLKQIHRLHQNKIHKLILLNNKDKGERQTITPGTIHLLFQTLKKYL